MVNMVAWSAVTYKHEGKKVSLYGMSNAGQPPLDD